MGDYRGRARRVTVRFSPHQDIRLFELQWRGLPADAAPRSAVSVIREALRLYYERHATEVEPPSRERARDSEVEGPVPRKRPRGSES